MRLLQADRNNGLSIDEELKDGRILYGSLPLSHSLTTNFNLDREINRNSSDVDFYDTLLHSNDVDFTVPELVDYITSADLRIAQFVNPWQYDPTIYFHKYPQMMSRIANLTWLDRATLAEEMAGVMKKHGFWCVPAPQCPDCHITSHTMQSPVNQNSVIMFTQHMSRIAQEISKMDLSDNYPAMQLNLDGSSMQIKLPPLAPLLMRYIDGKRTMLEVYDACIKHEQCAVVGPKALSEQLGSLTKSLREGGLVVVGNKANRHFISEMHW